MERWKELLLIDLKAVRKGYEETGKDASKVIEAIEHIPFLDEIGVATLLAQNELRYFASKVESLDYHNVVKIEEDQAAQAKQAKKAKKA